MNALPQWLRARRGYDTPSPEDALQLEHAPAAELMPIAANLTYEAFGDIVSYSRKVFIPLTQLCRDVCHYCTFAKSPRRVLQPYLSAEQVLAIARAGADAGCKEALFTLGDKPELRYRAARQALADEGDQSTIDYLERLAGRVLEDTGLLPHLNPGVMTPADLARLRPVSASMGIMLESGANRLADRGGPHFGSPDKRPARRLETLREAGKLRIPMTTGLLVGIGETRRERIEALLALREVHEEFGHLQEIIIQNFKAKPDTRMAAAPEPAFEEQLWTVAVTRLIFGSKMSIQAPPNLQPHGLNQLIQAGINDWGGVSPVTPDHVNPEAPWPHVDELARRTADAGRYLVERLAIVPSFAQGSERWTDPEVGRRVRRLSDSRGYARSDLWFAGSIVPLPEQITVLPSKKAKRTTIRNDLATAIGTAQSGSQLTPEAIVRLFSVEGREFEAVLTAANALRRTTVGDTVTYVVNRNINYTNICLYHCGFCAFSKGRSTRDLRGPAYNLSLEEIAQRASEAAQAGATEVCLQGGIHPGFTGETYLKIVAAVKQAVPSIHVHAFSPLEIRHGAQTLGLRLIDYLQRLAAAGLSSLPGTAAEILDDDIRRVICPDKLRTEEWIEVISSAHRVGLTTTATIMYGHVEQPVHWARHLLHLRAIQTNTGGITEFVPLAFVHMEAPLWRKGQTRSGPTFREALLMHAVARLALHPLIPNIQTSWVKMGALGAARSLNAGANDLGGTLMNESITRAAGGAHGQLMDAGQLEALARSVGRAARQRTTLYGRPTIQHQGGPIDGAFAAS
jgi:FO synthase